MNSFAKRGHKMDASKTNFSIARAIICFYLLIFHPSFQITDLDPAAFMPVGIFHLLPGPISVAWFFPIELVWRLSLIVAGLGILRPWAMGLALLSGTYVLGYINNFQISVHGTTVAYLKLWILFLGQLAGNHSRKPFIMIAQILIVLSYFFAGVQKLRSGGFAWAWSENLAVYIMMNRLTPSSQFLLSLDPIWIRLVASAALIGELLSPLALIGYRWALPFIIFWTAFHIGTNVIFDYHASFLSQIACLAFFVNWDQVVPRKLKNKFK
jgi:hypothetical protein